MKERLSFRFFEGSVDETAHDKTRAGDSFSLQLKRPWSDTLRRGRRILCAVGTTAVLLTACGSDAPTVSTQLDAASLFNGKAIASQTQSEFFEPVKTGRYLQGPHDTTLKHGSVWDAIDIGNDRPFSFSKKGEVLEQPPVVASASGTVIKVGDPNNPNDPDHSVVKIKSAQGLIVGEMHLGKITVSPGDKVIGGQTEIGRMANETPPGGFLDGAHVHLYLMDSNQQRIPINGHTFSGYTVNQGIKEGQGTMVKPGFPMLTADGRNCRLPADCGGIINYFDLAGQTAAQTDAKAPATTAEKPPQAGFVKYNSKLRPYQMNVPNGFKLVGSNTNAGKTITSEYFSPDMSDPPVTLMVIAEQLPPGGASLNDIEKVLLDRLARSSPFTPAGGEYPGLADGTKTYTVHHGDPYTERGYLTFNDAETTTFMARGLAWQFQLVEQHKVALIKYLIPYHIKDSTWGGYLDGFLMNILGSVTFK